MRVFLRHLPRNLGRAICLMRCFEMLMKDKEVSELTSMVGFELPKEDKRAV